MAVKRITIEINSETVSGRSSQQVWDDIDEEIRDIDPDFISPLSSERCVETKLNTRGIYKSLNRHLRNGDKLWVSGLTQWPQFTTIDPKDLAWLKIRL